MSELKKEKLGDITISITDGKHGDCKNQDGSGYYFISCKDVYGGCIHYESARQIEKEDFEDANERTKLEPNDILITNSGTIGRMALVKDIPLTSRTTFQKSVAIIKPNIKITNHTYLYYLLRNCVSDFINRSNGSAQKNLLLSTMRNFEVNYLTSKEKQEQLVHILSRYDSLIENYQRQIKLLEEAAQRLYKEWFINLKFPGHEKAKIVNGVPEGWEIDKIGDRLTTVLGGTPSRRRPNYWGGQIAWINSGELNKNRIIEPSEFITEEGLNHSATKLLPIHTTVLALTGATLGQVSYTEIKTCANQSVVGIIDESNNMSEYVFLYIKDNIQSIINTATGGAQQHINKDIVNNYKIIIPKEETLRLFEEKIKPLFSIEAKRYKQIHLLTEARDRLLPKLMSREIAV